MMDKAAVFILRDYPSVDNITPIIYKISKETAITGEVFVLSPQLLEDYRIELLQTQKNINIFVLTDAGNIYNYDDYNRNDSPNQINQTPRTVQHIKNIGKKLPTDIPRLIWHASTLAERVEDIKYPMASTLLDTFDQYDQLAVLFDWPSPPTGREGRFMKNIVTEAKKRDIATAALPHGGEGYINYLKYNHMLKSNGFDLNSTYKMLIDDNKLKGYDYHVVPSQLRAKKYQFLRDDEELRILGSPRYCDEWIEINSRISPEYSPVVSDENLNILFLLAKRTMPVFWDEVRRTVKILSKVHRTNLVIKGHPRSNYADIEQICDTDKYTFRMEDDHHSVSLIKWADVVISLGGSIDFSAVVRELPLLEMEYLHANHTTVASHAVGTQVDCRDEMIDTIKDLRDGDKECTYSKAGRQRLLDEMIRANDTPPLSNYMNFITEMM